MTFARVQANKLLILHSKRIDSQVKQIKLYTFNTFSDAQDMVDSDSKWNLFCESLRIQFNVKIKDTKLHENIRTKLKGLEFEETDSTNTAVLQVLNFLKNCKPPLSPNQILTLKRSKTNLLLLKDMIGKKLLTFEEPMESVRTDEETEAEKCLELGLELYRQGDWDEAKRYFLNGLKSEPKHVDLLVHDEDAFRYLLPGIIKIPDIANMLIGKEKPEETRYLGNTLPSRLKASEFIHEQGYLFKNNFDFRNLIRCVLEDDVVLVLLRKLEIKRKKRKNDKNYKMDKKSWNLLYGSISDEFINQYVSKFVGKLNDKNGDYWKPTIGEILKVQIIEKKQRNWLIQ